MASYYYLISSLPTLSANSPMPFSYEEFLSQCKTTLPVKVYENLERMSLENLEGPLVKQWNSYYCSLKRELDNQRRVKLGKDVKENSNASYDVCSVVRQAMDAKNPLEAEQIMLKNQFDHLDSIVSMHYFDDYVLYGYAVKMKLLERQSKFIKEKGEAEFSRLFTNIQNKIMEI